MSGITLRIDKGKSGAFSKIMDLVGCFSSVRECKRHYTVKISEEEAFMYQDQLRQIIQILPGLSEKEWFNIPDYGTDEWANWMIDLHRGKQSK